MLLLFYGCMTGFGSSVVRASGMFLIFLASEYLGRPYDLMSAMSLTGILMILEHPYRILEPGFQISYAAVSAIGWIFPFVKSCMNMEEETPNEPPTEPTETIKSDEQTVEPTEVKEEPTEHQDEPTEKQADVNQDVTRLEELIKNLNAEIESLKNMNGDLNTKVKELSKEPSAKPLNPNSKPSESNTYSQWREQMRNMIG